MPFVDFFEQLPLPIDRTGPAGTSKAAAGADTSAAAGSRPSAVGGAGAEASGLGGTDATETGAAAAEGDSREAGVSAGNGGTGARRPDVVVALPGGKSIAIDAKVPLAAYLDATALPAVGSQAHERERARLLAEHARALRGHVDALANRRYWSGLSVSPEFTVMFIPTESLLAEALKADPSLLEYALARNVAPTTPASLLALLKTVATIWQQSTVTEQARDLLELGRELYGRLGTLGDHVGKLGRTLTSAVRDYNRVVGSLERGIVVTARRFEAFDTSKLNLPSLDSKPAQVRRITAPELTPSPPEPEPG
jgi:DNA recombination protein RmuC